ncbi:MAG: hypothetical protein JWM16_1213 [Verrucomicrobiales bacterium]|nr:hypothetical protein [Verrucomicrobiales bacterium]
MHLRLRIWAGILMVSACAGCQKPNAAAPPSTAAAAQPNNTPLHLDHAMPKLRTTKLWLGAQELDTELALSSQEISTGMMFRKDMGENEGMLFVFAQPQKLSFYMKNTTVPLSCAYIDAEGTILEIHDLKPLDETPVDSKAENILYVLEVKQGWFKRHNIETGMIIRTERGTMPETFFPKRAQQ